MAIDLDSHPAYRGPEAADPSAGALDLVLMRVRLRARRRAAWLGHLWGRADSQAGDGCLAAAWDDRDEPEAEAVWYRGTDEVRAWNHALDRVEEALAGEAGAPLQRLVSLFGLTEPELDVLETCLGVTLDPTLGPAYAYLQHHAGRTFATEGLVARLFGYGTRSLWHPGLPLATWGLVVAAEAGPGEPTPLVCDPQVLRWLQGELNVDEALVGAVQEVQPREPLTGWPVSQTSRVVGRAVERNTGIRVLVSGPPGSGRRTFAAVVASSFGIRTLAVEIGDVGEADWPDVFMRIQRLAVLGNTALVWHGNGVIRPWPSRVPPAPIQFVACDEGQVVPPHPSLIDHRAEMPTPTLDERRNLWGTHVAQSAAWPELDFQDLVARHRLMVGDIVAVSQRGPSGAQEASVMCRELTRRSLGDLGRPLECPFTWEDLVVPSNLREALQEFAFEARERWAFWEAPKARRLFPRGTALVGLFTGPPGTGKTMAAQVIAGDLDLDLFRIDLATVVSKYIGETAKNLKRIFSHAGRMNAVLLFDEADALFSKRTEVRDAHDRYANTDTNYLLQLLEEYQGIALLATNKKGNIDPAFVRRVRYAFDFPRPDGKHRRRIWRQVIGEMSDGEALQRLDGAIEGLANGVEMSGAQIKNAVLASLFVARRSRRPLGVTHLLRGIEREFGKEGRSLGKDQRKTLMRYV